MDYQIGIEREREGGRRMRMEKKKEAWLRMNMEIGFEMGLGREGSEYIDRDEWGPRGYWHMHDASVNRRS